jgi:hypothetical protein
VEPTIARSLSLGTDEQSAGSSAGANPKVKNGKNQKPMAPLQACHASVGSNTLFYQRCLFYSRVLLPPGRALQAAERQASLERELRAREEAWGRAARDREAQLASQKQVRGGGGSGAACSPGGGSRPAASKASSQACMQLQR